MLTHPPMERAIGHALGWFAWARSAASRFSSGQLSAYVTWMRFTTSTLFSASISPAASDVRKPSPAGMPRASRARPSVPVSQAAVAATR